MRALLALLLALPALAGPVGTRAPGPQGGFGKAKFSPVSKSWGDALGFHFAQVAPGPGVSPGPRYDAKRPELLEPLAWALSLAYAEPLAFATLGEAERAQAVADAMALAAQEVAAKAYEALRVWADPETAPRALEASVQRAAAIGASWGDYLPKDLRAEFTSRWLEAARKVALLREQKVLQAMEKTAEALSGPSSRDETDARDAGIGAPLAEHLAARLAEADAAASKELIRQLSWTAARFPETRPVLVSALLQAAQTGEHARRYAALETLRLAFLSDLVPEPLQAQAVATLSGLEYPTLILRRLAMEAVAAIGRLTKDGAAREAAYRALARESLGPNMKKDMDFDDVVLSAKKDMDLLMGGLPHPEVVEEYRRRWLKAAKGEADKEGTGQRLGTLEKMYPALKHNLQMPLNPPVEEKAAKDLKPGAPELPPPSPN